MTLRPLRALALVFLLQLNASTPSLGQTATCADYFEHLRWAGGAKTEGLGVRIAPSGGYLLVSDGDFGMRVVDVDPPGQSSIVATVPTLSSALLVEVVGSTAFVLGEHSWNLVDVSDPASPGVMVTRGGSNGPPTYTAGTIDPRTDILGGSPTEPDVVYYAWTAGYDNEIAIYDVTNPQAPVQISSYFFIFDTPRSIRYVARRVNGEPRSYLYVAADDFYIIDVTDPGSPTTVAQYNLSAKDINGAGDFAYAAAGGVLRILDVSDPTQPIPISLLGVFDDPVDVSFMGADLLVSSERGGVNVIDVSNPAQPSLVQTIYTPAEANQACAVGSELYVADRIRSVHVFDVGTLDPVPTGAKVDTPGEAVAIHLEGDHAYVADRESGLQVFDIQDPDTPLLVGGLLPKTSAANYEFLDVEVSGQTAYVAGNWDGFHIIDVSDPPQPAYLSSPMPVAEGVHLEGNLAYVVFSVFSAGVTILDVSNGAAPATVGTLSLPPNLTNLVTVIGDVLYVGSANDGLWTIDVDDPSAPVPVGQLPGIHHTMIPAAHPGLAYAVNGSSIEVLDLTDPFHPVVVATAQAGLNARELFLEGSVLYAACRRMGIHALDVTNPLQPVNFGSVQPQSTPAPSLLYEGMNDVRVWGNRLLVAGGQEGLVVLPVPCPSSVDSPVATLERDGLRVSAEPNPFRGATELELTLERDSRVRVDIHDVRGRLVRRLLDGPRSAGRHVLSWDGHNASGRAVAAGIYFVKAESGGEVRAAKLVRLR